MRTIGILVFDDVEELDFAGPLEVFGTAARFGADCRTVILAEERRAVRCRAGLNVIPDLSIAEAPALDILIVPGGLGARTHARSKPAILRFVREQRGFVASVCTGALILSNAGILDGLSATTHHSSLDLLGENPNVVVQRDVRFVMHDGVATSAGVSAGIDLALAIVSREWGPAIAARVASNMEWKRSFSVRRATKDDAHAVRECLAAAFAPYRDSYTLAAYDDTVPTAEGMRRRFETMFVFVATADSEEVIGTISCSVSHEGEGHLRGMAVRPEWQGSEVARALLEAAEGDLRDRKCRRVTLDTTDPLQRAMRFYERRGYRRSGAVSDFFGMPLHEYVKTL